MPGTHEAKIDGKGNFQVDKGSPFDGNTLPISHFRSRPHYFFYQEYEDHERGRADGLKLTCKSLRPRGVTIVCTPNQGKSGDPAGDVLTIDLILSSEQDGQLVLLISDDEGEEGEKICEHDGHEPQQFRKDTEPHHDDKISEIKGVSNDAIGTCRYQTRSLIALISPGNPSFDMSCRPYADKKPHCHGKKAHGPDDEIVLILIPDTEGHNKEGWDIEKSPPPIGAPQYAVFLDGRGKIIRRDSI